jgi:hypothetical protein
VSKLMVRDGLEVTASRPRDSLGGWRWFLCYRLIKLAAWIYPFKLRFYREREWIDDVGKH